MSRSTEPPGASLDGVIASAFGRAVVMLRGLFLDRFDDLLAAWRSHQRLRAADSVTVEQLAESRLRLDRLRDEANQIRRSYAPESRELESVLLTAFCTTFDETVFLFQRDAEWSGGHQQFRCVCGSLVDAVHSA